MRVSYTNLKDKTPDIASKMAEIEMLNQNLQKDIEVLDNKITNIQDTALNAANYQVTSPKGDSERVKLKQSKQSLTKT